MASTKRRASRLSPEKRTADILVAARAVFAERGYNDMVMSEIAERAGVVEGSIYRYFRNKRDLMFRMAEAWFEEMIEDDAATLAAIEGTRNRLRFIIHRHLRSIHQQPDMSRLVFQHLRPEPDYRDTRLFALNRAYTARVSEVVAAGMKAGEIRSGLSPTLVRDVIFGSIEHRTWAFLRNEGDYDVDGLADQVLDLVWRGLEAPREAASTQEILGRIEALLSDRAPS
ncbi:TetR/AcrR family transcriptional regulator [Seohaeicola nanhaiensis]|uniref:TetR/AcrR family transcriptional regulator n=1 Tax=Seohaeicola nanhaiensis TaxID=1387282 RepID=A0ABV9KGW4_9RHOB